MKVRERLRCRGKCALADPSTGAAPTGRRLARKVAPSERQSHGGPDPCYPIGATCRGRSARGSPPSAAEADREAATSCVRTPGGDGEDPRQACAKMKTGPQGAWEPAFHVAAVAPRVAG